MMTIKKYSKTIQSVLKVFFLLLLVCNVIRMTEAKTYATSVREPETVVSDTQNKEGNILGINISTTEEGGLSGALQIVLVLTVIALCPSLLIMVTSFVRIIIVLHFTRAALNTQTAPPNQVLIGLALFLTVFIMAPTFTQIYNEAIKPYEAGELTEEEAFDIGCQPLKTFMLNQVKDDDLNTMAEIAGVESIETREDVSLTVLIPAFIMSELRIAFWIGFLIYIPFLVIDMVVSSTLMSMGMMMLPPTTISMPFKILLFVLADGWNIVIVNTVKTFVV